jgi:hypothetical protein
MWPSLWLVVIAEIAAKEHPPQFIRSERLKGKTSIFAENSLCNGHDADR